MSEGSPLVDLRSCLPKEVLVKGKDGQVASRATRDVITGKFVGLYFSASWCPPCRSFTPVLIDAYNKATAAGKAFEVVFVSSDNSEESFDEYYRKMPWTALPFGATQKSALSSRFKVQGIPTLVILDPQGQVVSTNARSAVMADPARFPWEGAAESGNRYRNLIMWLLLGAWLLYRFLWR